MLFTGDTLFPGGPGNTALEGGDFASIITSIEERIFRVFAAETTIWPGHGAPSTLASERPHLDEWVERGW
jgi:glyoxylase-like metal-dependent hydrolase (beta-lactamase superfamily II)